jgi:hypothetical protein
LKRKQDPGRNYRNAGVAAHKDHGYSNPACATGRMCVSG